MNKYLDEYEKLQRIDSFIVKLLQLAESTNRNVLDLTFLEILKAATKKEITPIYLKNIGDETPDRDLWEISLDELHFKLVRPEINQAERYKKVHIKEFKEFISEIKQKD